MARPTPENAAKRGRGRPRKPSVPAEETPPSLPAHRPPVPFVEDPDRFAVVLSIVFEAISTTVEDGVAKQKLKATRARDMAAIILDPEARSTIAAVPKVGWDSNEWKLARKLKVKQGAFLRMELRPDLDEIERLTATDLNNADRRFRRKIGDLEADPEGKAWAVLCGEALFKLRSPDPLIRMGARMQLQYRGWAPATLDMLAEYFFAI